jgi:3-oxoacyl-[acyl-carrier-protein] synthase II
MSINRVVITGQGAVSPYGKGVEVFTKGLREGRSAVTSDASLSELGGLRSRVQARVKDIDPKEIPRKFRRSMSPMSIFATLASFEALESAGLGEEACASGRLGVAISSTTGSTQGTQSFFEGFLENNSLEELKSTHFFQIMNHSAAANVAQALGIRGRMFSPAAACASATQSIGLAFENIKHGYQDMYLCGGTDEYHPLTTGVFDIMNAASSAYNDSPTKTPRPFDKNRDGVVCSEGAGILLLESLPSAQKRGVKILAEVCGFSTFSDPGNIANPDPAIMQLCMKEALKNASISAENIDYVNAHATGTEFGDVAESQAIGAAVGDKCPVSSFKGHFGHSMAASGSLELIGLLDMLEHKYLIPTLNLEEIDPDCGAISHAKYAEDIDCESVIKNNFALGGVNTSLVIRSYKNG